MSAKFTFEIAVIDIDIGKNSFHVIGQNKRGAIMLRQKWSRGQVEARLANLPPCLIGAHHLSRKLQHVQNAPKSRHAPSLPPPAFGERRVPKCA